MKLLVVLTAITMVHAMDASEDHRYGFKTRWESVSPNKNEYKHRQCRPHNCIADKVSCEKFGKPVPMGGGFDTNWGIHYNLMFSPYYGARIADAFGFAKCCLGKNCTLAGRMNLMTTWSGSHGPIGVDGIFGFDRNILRRCVFPSGKYPFFCTGSKGTPDTQGDNLGTLSYITLLHDDRHHRWTLFGNCWNPKTPQNPNAIPTATSFIVYSLDSKLSSVDKNSIIAKLKQIGFSTDDIIEPDYTSDPSPIIC